MALTLAAATVRVDPGDIVDRLRSMGLAFVAAPAAAYDRAYPLFDLTLPLGTPLRGRLSEAMWAVTTFFRDLVDDYGTLDVPLRFEVRSRPTRGPEPPGSRPPAIVNAGRVLRVGDLVRPTIRLALRDLERGQSLERVGIDLAIRAGVIRNSIQSDDGPDEP